MEADAHSKPARFDRVRIDERSSPTRAHSDRSIWLVRDTRAGMGWRRRKRGPETSHRNRAKVYGVHVLVLVRCGVCVVIAVFTEHFGRFRGALEARRPDLWSCAQIHRDTTNIGKPKKRESYDRVVPMSGNTNLSYPRRCCLCVCGCVS